MILLELTSKKRKFLDYKDIFVKVDEAERLEHAENLEGLWVRIQVNLFFVTLYGSLYNIITKIFDKDTWNA